ncbi:MAG TPA: MFS transporter [Chloroflexia bacterium]|nr:MFS transporter [Chloroflexia bacterium]
MSAQEVIEKGKVGELEELGQVTSEAEEAKPEPVDDIDSDSPWAALRHRDFRLLWSGGFVSQLGSQMRIVAIDVQLWDLTHSYAMVGLLGLFQLLPLLGFSLFGGVLADAFDRRHMMMITQTTYALSSVVLALATWQGWVSAPLVYAIGALGAATTAFDNPARSALVPNLVPRKDLANALSLNIIIGQMATIGGPTLAGILVATGTSGLALIYTLDAVSFGAVLVSLFFMRIRTEKPANRNVSLKAVFEGFHFLRNTPIIMSTMSLDFFATFFGAASVLLPALSEQVLHVDRSLLGVLYAAPAMGALVAGLAMSWLGNVHHQGKIVLWSVGAYGVATLVFGLSQNYWLTLVALAGTGAADTVSMVMRQTIRQLNTPDELRGRLTSVNMIFYIGGPRLGQLEAGLGASALGLSPSIAIGGIGVLVVTALIGKLVPSLRVYDR